MRPPAYASVAGIPAHAGRLGRRAPLGVRLAGWRGEVLLFGLAYLAYQAARAVARGGLDEALVHAHQVMGAERALGIDVEGPIQAALLGTAWLSALDWIYLAAQTVVLAGGILLVYRTSRPVYRVLRTTLIATWILALPVYVLFATAPPRLAGLGFTDTVSENTPISLGAGSTSLLYNPYAAVPSLHAGFALALGIAVALSTRSTAVRIAGVLWGPLVILATIATGNHFLIDVAAGLVLTAAGLGIALYVKRAGSAAGLSRGGRAAPSEPRATLVGPSDSDPGLKRDHAFS